MLPHFLAVLTKRFQVKLTINSNLFVLSESGQVQRNGRDTKTHTELICYTCNDPTVYCSLNPC